MSEREYDSRYWGEGPDATYLPAPCPECGGDGGHETWGAFCSVAGDIQRGWQKCSFCDGTGEVETQPTEMED